MTLKKHVLVVANVTATSEGLLRALVDRAASQPASFTLVVPAANSDAGATAAQARVEQAISSLREAGLEADGSVGDSDPIVAVSEAWDPRRYDEIVVSTLPLASSRWLHAGLPERIFKLTGAPVTHIISPPPKPAVKSVTTDPRAHKGGLGPLAVLGWGGHQDRSGKRSIPSSR